MNNRRQFARVAIAASIVEGGMATHFQRIHEAHQPPEGVKVITMEAGMTIHDLHKAMKNNEPAVIVVDDANQFLGSGIADRVKQIIEAKEAAVPKELAPFHYKSRRERRAEARKRGKHG